MPVSLHLPLEPAVVGRSGWGAEGRWSRSLSTMCAVELTLAGNGILDVNQEMHHAAPRDAIILHRGESQSYRTGPAGQWDRLFVTFLEESIDPLLKRVGLDQVTIVHLQARTARAVAKHLHAIKKLLRNQPPGFRVETATRAFQLVLTIAQATTGGTARLDAPPEKVACVTRYVQEHLEEKMPVEALARMAGCSRSHLERLFHRQFGVGVHHWIIATRITRAALHLLIGDRPISQIAVNAGYADIYQFSAAFKRIIGMSPRTYRRQGRQPGARQALPQQPVPGK